MDAGEVEGLDMEEEEVSNLKGRIVSQDHCDVTTVMKLVIWNMIFFFPKILLCTYCCTNTNNSTIPRAHHKIGISSKKSNQICKL